MTTLTQLGFTIPAEYRPSHDTYSTECDRNGARPETTILVKKDGTVHVADLAYERAAEAFVETRYGWCPPQRAAWLKRTNG